MTFVRLLSAAAAMLLSAAAAAQTFPERPLRLIIPFPPGGGGDLIGRLLSESMGKRLGQPVVAENRPGADQIVGTQALLSAPRDGYTIIANGHTHLAHMAFGKKLPYDPNELLPVGRIATVPILLIANPQLGARNLKELIAAAKARPGQVKTGHIGTSSTHHLAFRLIEQAAGVSFLSVPYKGSGQTITALLGGEIDAIFSAVGQGVELEKAGKAVVIGVSTKKRVSAFPQVPTIAEGGLPGYDFAAIFYVYTGMGAPQATVSRLNRELRASLEDPSVRGKLLGAGFEPEASTQEEAVAEHREYGEKTGRIIRTAGIKLEE